MDQSEIWKRIKENIISENFLLYFKNILMRKIYSSNPPHLPHTPFTGVRPGASRILPLKHTSTLNTHQSHPASSLCNPDLTSLQSYNNLNLTSTPTLKPTSNPLSTHLLWPRDQHDPLNGALQNLLISMSSY